LSHPVTEPKNKRVRDRLNDLVRGGLHRTASTNIIFVCGGDEEIHLRPKFIEYMQAEMPGYRPFRPEAAQKDYFEQDHEDTLNLSHFEELVSDLSLGIVLFAESPGSYAETGLFSALENARKKTLVILDAERQGKGSFLTFGPVAVIASKSRLGAAIQLDYENPKFSQIKDRIEDRIPLPSSYRSIGSKEFSDLEPQELLSFVWFYIDIMKACSFDDLVYCFDSAFSARSSKRKIREILSVLVGVGLVVRDGPLGLVRISDRSIELAEPSKAYQSRLTELVLEITNLLEECANVNYIEAAARAD
jgi:hypothetical protein